MNIPTKNSDPSGLVGGIGVFGSAVLAAVVVFGGLTPEQADALLNVVVSGVPLVIALVAWCIRRWAYAPDSVDQAVQQDRLLHGADRAGGS